MSITAESRIADIRAYLASARKNVLAFPNESNLVRQNCHREIEFRLAALHREGYVEYEKIRAEVQEAWAAINGWRDHRRRESLDQALNYKKPRSEGGKS